MVKIAFITIIYILVQRTIFNGTMAHIFTNKFFARLFQNLSNALCFPGKSPSLLRPTIMEER